MSKRGTFIVIEGTDGTGKATQTRRLARTLRRLGKPVRTISFPQYGQHSAAPIEAYLRGEYGPLTALNPYQASLFFAIDRVAARTKILRWLAEGNAVIADRYTTSNLAHQGAKISNRTERKQFWSWETDLEFRLLGIPKPDCIIVLYMPTKISKKLNASKRNRTYLQSKRDIAEHDANHQRRASDVYRELTHYLPHIKLIDCAPKGKLLPIKDIHQMVFAAVTRRLN